MSYFGKRHLSHIGSDAYPVSAGPDSTTFPAQMLSLHFDSFSAAFRRQTPKMPPRSEMELSFELELGRMPLPEMYGTRYLVVNVKDREPWKATDVSGQQ